MNKNVSSLIMFAAKSFIVGFTLYLIVNAVFLRDVRRVEKIVSEFEKKATTLEQQEKFISAFLAMLMAANSPEGLYYMAMGEEQNGNYAGAATKVAMALKLGQQNLEKYQMKLNELKEPRGK